MAFALVRLWARFGPGFALKWAAREAPPGRKKSASPFEDFMLIRGSHERRAEQSGRPLGWPADDSSGRQFVSRRRGHLASRPRRPGARFAGGRALNELGRIQRIR